MECSYNKIKRENFSHRVFNVYSVSKSMLNNFECDIWLKGQ